MSTFKTALAAGLALALSVAPVAAQDFEAPTLPVIEALQLTRGTIGRSPDRAGFSFRPGAESLPVGHVWHLRLVSESATSPRRSPAIAMAPRSLRAPTVGSTNDRAEFRRQSFMEEHPAKFGAALGAAIGAAIAIISVATMDCPPTRSCSTAAVALFAYPLYGAGAGALVGWMIGSK